MAETNEMGVRDELHAGVMLMCRCRLTCRRRHVGQAAVSRWSVDCRSCSVAMIVWLLRTRRRWVNCRPRCSVCMSAWNTRPTNWRCCVAAGAARLAACQSCWNSCVLNTKLCCRGSWTMYAVNVCRSSHLMHWTTTQWVSQSAAHRLSSATAMAWLAMQAGLKPCLRRMSAHGQTRSLSSHTSARWVPASTSVAPATTDSLLKALNCFETCLMLTACNTVMRSTFTVWYYTTWARKKRR